MFVDYVKVQVQAGDGGNGVCSFRREKFIPHGGPDGGDGGKGGDIIFQADPGLATLLDLRMRPLIRAQAGAHGQGRNKSGRAGQDIVIRLPLGAMVLENDGLLADLTEPGMAFVAAAGGGGGRGNQHFATPSNRAPRRCTPGVEGQKRSLVIELKQIADVGLVGLPNAGKSTLLGVLTDAKPKIAPYPFTTLHPNLGVMEDPDGRHIVLADLPGLIEGASRGEGLGHRFLRHVERTGMLAHLAAFDPDEEPDYENLRCQIDLIEAELRAYSESLPSKKRVFVLSKADLCPPESRRPLVERFREEGFETYCLSSKTGEGLEEFRIMIFDHFARQRADAEEKDTPED
jgi:GTP-binding protein